MRQPPQYLQLNQAIEQAKERTYQQVCAFEGLQTRNVIGWGCSTTSATIWQGLKNMSANSWPSAKYKLWDRSRKPSKSTNKRYLRRSGRNMRVTGCTTWGSALKWQST